MGEKEQIEFPLSNKNKQHINKHNIESVKKQYKYLTDAQLIEKLDDSFFSPEWSAEQINSYAEEADSSRKLTWQYESLVQMIGKGSDSLNMTEFQAKLTQVMEVGENPAMRELIRVEDGAFVYQWAEISRLLEQKKLRDQELNALLKALKLTLYEKEGREELYQQWLERIKQALSGMEPGSHQHLAALIRQCGELVVFDVISRAEYEDLEAQYLWSQLTKLEQDKTIVLLEAEANKEFLMAEYGLTEEEFRLYKENLCVMLELWDEYEEEIEKYSALTMQERIDRYEFGANPITEFIFLSQWPEFTKAERIAFMEEIQEHGLLSDQAYERIVGEAPNKDATAMIELTYRASLTRMTFDEMMQQDAREQSARLNQFIGGVLLMNLMDINATDQNPAPYDGNLNPIYRLDQMELNSKNGFKNYAYVPLSRETIDWLREHDTSLNLVIEGKGKYDVNGKYTGGRTQVELDDLSYDPAKGSINKSSMHEAEMGLDLEESGRLGRLERSYEPTSDFIDTTNGNKIDMKEFKSYPIGSDGKPITSPGKGAFNINRVMENIRKEFSKNGNDIIFFDKTGLTTEHFNQLINAIDEAGISDKILWWPE